MLPPKTKHGKKRINENENKIIKYIKNKESISKPQEYND
tara:strand:+ start:281 stop:397 length:117 start_codon:yes stop_codon:yes gene_type:complete